MGFFGDIIGIAVNVVLTPVVIVKDVVNIATDQELNSTANHIDSIIDDIDNALNL